MKPAEIRKILREYLYEQPVVLILENGSRHHVATIEHISVADDRIHLVDRNRQGVLIKPEGVTEIRPLPRPRRNSRPAHRS